jgi:hypothetical protein
MFKRVLLLCIVLVFSSSVYGEISPKELRQYSKVIRMDAVRATSDKRGDKKSEKLEIEFSGGDDDRDPKYLENTWIRFSVEITDKAAKKTYLAEIKRKHGAIAQEGANYDSYSGEGWWVFTIPCTEQLDRLRISAYVLQYGLMDGDVFVPFQEKIKGVKSYDELLERTTTSYPEKCSLRRTIYVDGL